MSLIQKKIDEIIEREGGAEYTNHPADRGGPTRWGITEKTARRHGYTGDMRELPRALAVNYYLDDYVLKPGFDKVLIESELIAAELMDTGVNCGPSRPGPWLQRVLNALNQPMHPFPQLEIDGKIGSATMFALRRVIEKRGRAGEIVILRGLNSLQGVYYLEITEKRPANRAFYYGWMNNRVSI